VTKKLFSHKTVRHCWSPTQIKLQLIWITSAHKLYNLMQREMSINIKFKQDINKYRYYHKKNHPQKRASCNFKVKEEFLNFINEGNAKCRRNILIDRNPP
jgi:hypothetical protein